MITYDEAIHRVIDTVKVLPPVEETIENALGRVLAAPVRARWAMPPVDNSAMDGFALKGTGLTAGSELRVVGFVPAGRPFTQAISEGEAVRIMTGAPIPAGCDTVVPMEEAEVEDDRIHLRKTPGPGQHIRRRGEEFEEGEPLLSPGTPLYAGEIALLATAGISTVQVYPRPRVALLATGDELVELGAPPGPGQIINSNTYLLAARLREEGCHVLPLGIARDEQRDLGDKIAAGLRLDVLITTGGVSVGDRDLVQDALGQHGFSPIFWKVKIKPGKPVLFGTAGKTAVFGLPGNPASSASTFELFVRPALRRMAGFRDPLPPRLKVTLSTAIDGGEKRQRFLWGTLHEDQGSYHFNPSSRQSSGQNRSLQGAQALLPVPAESPAIAAGTTVEVLLLRLPPGQSLQETAPQQSEP